MGLRIIKTIIFCLAVFIIIIGLETFFYRDTDGTQTRDRIYTLHNQPKNTIDVVFIGSSGLYRGWSSVEAWHDYGYTSWVWATPAQPFFSAKYIIKDIQRTQSPRLFIITYSQLKAEDRKYNESYIRNVVDNLPFSFNRLQAVNALMEYRKDGRISPLYYIFPFFRFHDDWENVLNGGKRPPMDINTMGTFLHQTNFQAQPVNIFYPESDSNETLDAYELKQLTNFLSWLKEEDLPVLFIITPIAQFSEMDVGRLNAVENVFTENGFPYINFSKYMGDIGLDAETDFQDNTHLDHWGRTKFTGFVSEYLLANYSLPDHRTDAVYAAWDGAYENFMNMVDNITSQNE